MAVCTAAGLLVGLSNVQGQISPVQPVVPVTGSGANAGSVTMMLKETSLPVADMAAELPGLLGLSEKHSFSLLSTKTDQLGMTHQSYRQLFEGVPVEEGMILVHFREGKAQSLNGRLARLASLSTNPAVDGQEAYNSARNYSNSLKGDRDYPVELLIVSLNGEQAGYALAYKVRVDGQSPEGIWKMMDYYIDAQSGKLIRSVNLLHTDVEQVAHTLYSGPQTITVDSGAFGYRLRDNKRLIETYDVGGLDRSRRGDLYFRGVRDIYNTGNEWTEQPAIMTMTLTNVANNMLSGLGFQNGGRFVTSFIVRDSGSGEPELMTWPDIRMSQNTSTSVPVIARNIYVFPKDLLYWGGFGKFNLSSEEVTDSAFFNVNNIASGIFPWTDAGGNAGSYEVSMEKNPALDAHWGMARTHDYYQEIFNRNSYDGAGSVVRNYINGIWPMTLNQTNAAALPGPDFGMVYGLGDGVAMNPVVGLDVMGHEFTHMVTETNGNGGLIYMGESGALNESFSDIFGTCIEFYTKPEEANWNIGEDVVRSRIGFMRSMELPKHTNNPDTYRGTFWADTENNEVDNGGVHINSGVQNKWFYLLTEGGSGTNDKSDDYTVKGIGMKKAEQIAYRNLVNYLTPASRFYDAYKGSLLATADLFGDTSEAYQAVKDAWFAVGITEADSVLSVSETATPVAVQVYPNPASQQITIASDESKAFSVYIINILGVPVIKSDVQRGLNSVDISSLPKGIYTIQYSDGSRKQAQKLSVL